MEEVVLMELFKEFYEPCVLLEKRRVSDGEGGWITQWEDGLEFNAAIIMDNTMTARVAESEGMTSIYTVTTDKNVAFDFHDVFKRVSDGKTFRVTSDPKDRQTPIPSTFEFEQVNAEAWSLVQ